MMKLLLGPHRYRRRVHDDDDDDDDDEIAYFTVR